MKLFRTSDNSVITYCREMFQFDLPSAILKKRAEKFDSDEYIIPQKSDARPL